MRQCELSHKNKHLVAWIDVNPKDVGKYVDIDDTEWMIKNIYRYEKTKLEVSDKGQEYKNMRKVTDI